MFEKMNADLAKKKKSWPLNGPWPEPIEDGFYIAVDEYEVDDAHRQADPFMDELMEVMEYANECVEDGILSEDYEMVEESDEENLPERWEDFFVEDRFDIDYWKECFAERYYQLKLEEGPAEFISDIIGYAFINENLLRQAFTRKSFAIEYGLGEKGSYEELEFIGDRILDLIVTKELAKQFTEVNHEETAMPFESKYTAGQFTEMKANFVCKDHLAHRAELLGLDEFILYGSNDEKNDNAKEDIIEAIIGAVATDCEWNMGILEEVVDRLIGLQLNVTGLVPDKNFYDIFNAWHTQHFGNPPSYDVVKSMTHHGAFECTLRFHVPENDQGIMTTQYIKTLQPTRSLARGRAAEEAQRMIQKHGLWLELKESGIRPEFDHCINQWQELYQKKYIDTLPDYQFEERSNGSWYCHCECDTVMGFGIAGSKVQAKKRAAFMALKQLFAGAGISDPKWDELVKDHLKDMVFPRI